MQDWGLHNHRNYDDPHPVAQIRPVNGGNNGEVRQGLSQLHFTKPDAGISANGHRLLNQTASSSPLDDLHIISHNTNLACSNLVQYRKHQITITIKHCPLAFINIVF